MLSNAGTSSAKKCQGMRVKKEDRPSVYTSVWIWNYFQRIEFTHGARLQYTMHRSMPSLVQPSGRFPSITTIVEEIKR